MKTKAILKDYFQAITNVASQGDAREESFYSCLETLLQQFAASTDRSEVHRGWPYLLDHGTARIRWTPAGLGKPC